MKYLRRSTCGTCGGFVVYDSYNKEIRCIPNNDLCIPCLPVHNAHVDALARSDFYLATKDFPVVAEVIDLLEGLNERLKKP